MLRWILLVTCVLSLAFAVSIFIIHAQPQRTAGLLAVLPNNGPCPAPCWQNLRPGVTSADEAVALLQQNRWIAEISVEEETIQWSWSGQQPPAVNAAEPGTLTIVDQRVSSIRISTNVSMGDMALLMGYPRWRSTNRSGGTAIITLIYPGDYLLLSISLRCPTNHTAFWLAKPEITLHSTPLHGGNLTPTLLHDSISC